MTSAQATATTVKCDPDNPNPDAYEKQRCDSTKCVSTGDCEDLIMCPFNRACFNSCDIGLNPGQSSAFAGGIFLSFLGIDDTGVGDSYKSKCRANCINTLVADCKGPQPADITDLATNPPSGDPALQCRQYCGAASGNPRFSWCENTCRNFDKVGFQSNGTNYASMKACYDQNKAQPDLISRCDQDKIPNTRNENYTENEANVTNKMRGFAKAAVCVLQPKTAGCDMDTMCTNFPFTSYCLQAMAKQHADMIARRDMLEKKLTDAAHAATKAADLGASAVDQALDVEKAVNAARKARQEKAAQSQAGDDDAAQQAPKNDSTPG